jgi:hypothetical protein
VGVGVFAVFAVIRVMGVIVLMLMLGMDGVRRGLWSGAVADDQRRIQGQARHRHGKKRRKSLPMAMPTRSPFRHSAKAHKHNGSRQDPKHIVVKRVMQAVGRSLKRHKSGKARSPAGQQSGRYGQAAAQRMQAKHQRMGCMRPLCSLLRGNGSAGRDGFSVIR